MTKQYWLVKSEPEAYSWADLVREGHTDWTGVRNYQARNHLKNMRKGDRVFYWNPDSRRVCYWTEENRTKEVAVLDVRKITGEFAGKARD